MKACVYLVGGLGNQLWIFLYAYHLLEYNDVVYIDSSWYHPGARFLFNPNRKLRHFHFSLFSNLSNRLLFRSNLFYSFLYRFTNIWILVSLVKRLLNIHYGYFQFSTLIDFKFLEGVRSSLHNFVSENYEHSVYEWFFCNDYDSVHLRCGDRGEIDNFLLYSYLSGIMPILDSQVCILSDNHDFAVSSAKLFPSSKTVIVLPANLSNEIFDFFVMSHSKSVFSIRDSTFSYWAQTLASFNTAYPSSFSK